MFKYGLYEIFKDTYMNLAGEEGTAKYKPLIWLAGSASAEVFADIALSPRSLKTKPAVRMMKRSSQSVLKHLLKRLCLTLIKLKVHCLLRLSPALVHRQAKFLLRSLRFQPFLLNDQST